MNFILYPVLALVFYLLMLIYFRIADHYNIIDHPNERSSHSEVTIRGGGIIFLFAALIIVVMYPGYWLPVTGTVIIGIISFLDDRLTLSSRLRIVVHLVAVTLMFLFLNVFNTQSAAICVLFYILVIGGINIYNFMDGINGIMGAYSLVVLAGLQYVNLYTVSFIQNDLIWIPMLACVVFLFFNFRRKAKCFAGDVGSVTIAFWIIMLILRLNLVSGHWVYSLFLTVYVVDAVLTIIQRLIMKQNIFKAHRLHFYQLLANEFKVSHLLVSSGYAVIQLLIIVFVIVNAGRSATIIFSSCLVPLIFIYIVMKMKLSNLKR